MRNRWGRSLLILKKFVAWEVCKGVVRGAWNEGEVSMSRQCYDKNVTHPEHTTHAEAFHLAEATEGLFGDVFDECVQRTLEERCGRCADLGVDADKVHERLIDVRSDF